MASQSVVARFVINECRCPTRWPGSEFELYYTHLAVPMTEIGGRPFGSIPYTRNSSLTARSFMMIVTAKVWIILSPDLHGHAMHPVTKGVYKHIIDFCQPASAAIPYLHSALTGFPIQD